MTSTEKSGITSNTDFKNKYDFMKNKYIYIWFPKMSLIVVQAS